ncbi:septum formation protein Maf [Lawsonia intracellularis]|uniref:Maf family nucleotide pyrophosphatase n=1 Tax=Lawsonia intracellularis TaxID=29546 RepID=UPI000976E723|nr:Maf family nucleotide pyrophosphatase [Lawsonia intracellularis]OMQ03187.1 septum formation protein Maf [Lawsonia intracellularis]
MTQQRVSSVFIETVPIVLASASPRRRSLLEQLGLLFKIVSVDSEPLPLSSEHPLEYVIRAAKVKAFAAAALEPRSVIIAADTVVIYTKDDVFEIIGKPQSGNDSFSMLSRFQGGKHQVITGCCIVWPLEENITSVQYETFYDTASIQFGQWDKDILSSYVSTGESNDKAGAFSIQGIGAFLIDIIEGNYTTILGLPLPQLVKRLLKRKAIKVVLNKNSEETISSDFLTYSR